MQPVAFPPKIIKVFGKKIKQINLVYPLTQMTTDPDILLLSDDHKKKQLQASEISLFQPNMSQLKASICPFANAV